MEDAVIIGLYWARNEEAIAASDEKYGKLCHNLSQNILNSPEDAEECVNDTWRKAWDTMPPQRPNSLRAYLTKITRNLSIDRWRSRRAGKRGSGLETLLDELDGCLPTAPSAEELTEAQETARAIDRWLVHLSTKIGHKNQIFLSLPPQSCTGAYISLYCFGVRYPKE